MRAFYTDAFVLPLPAGHRFPIDKYRRLRERVAESAPAGTIEPELPPPAEDRALLRAHDADWVERVRRGALTEREVRRIGFPWSAAMVERSLRSAGATIEACAAALDDGVAASLAGGTHHAFRDRGEGFCVFNDSVIAAREMQRRGRARRVAVIDTDVHQGNGTAAICAEDDSIFTCSIHGARNYPYRKERGDLDVALEDDTGDEPYLAALGRALERTFDAARPDLAIWVSGADPWQGDRWGRLGLTKAGLAARDRAVLEACRARGVPVAVTMGGGYAPDVEDIVDVHLHTVRAAAGLDGAGA